MKQLRGGRKPTKEECGIIQWSGNTCGNRISKGGKCTSKRGEKHIMSEIGRCFFTCGNQEKTCVGGKGGESGGGNNKANKLKIRISGPQRKVGTVIYYNSRRF